MGDRVRVEHEYGARNAGGRLFEYLQPLPTHLKTDEGEASNVPARMRQPRNEALIDGIVDRRHDYGNGTGGLPHRPNDWRGIGDDYVGRERHQFCRVSPYAADV